MLSISRRTLSAWTYRAFRTGKWSQSVRRENQSASATRGTGPSEGGCADCAVDHIRVGRMRIWQVGLVRLVEYDHAADVLSVPHVRVALVDLVQGVGPGDHLVELQLAAAVQ